MCPLDLPRWSFDSFDYYVSFGSLNTTAVCVRSYICTMVMGNLCPTVTCVGTLYSADCTVKGYYVPVPVRRVIQLSGVAVYVRGVSGA